MDNRLTYWTHEWHNQTTVHPLGLCLVIAMGLAMLALPRRYAIWPVLSSSNVAPTTRCTRTWSRVNGSTAPRFRRADEDGAVRGAARSVLCSAAM